MIDIIGYKYLSGGVKMKLEVDGGCLYLPNILSKDLAVKDLIPKAQESFFKLQSNPNLTFNGKKIMIDIKKDVQYSWSKCFDHLITERKGSIRIFSKARLRRIPWIEELLINCYLNECSNLIITKEEDDKPYYKLECFALNYRIILEERSSKNDYLLVTAYPIKDEEPIKEKVLLRNNCYKQGGYNE